MTTRGMTFSKEAVPKGRTSKRVQYIEKKSREKKKTHTASRNLALSRGILMLLISVFLVLVLVREVKISTLNKEISFLKEEIVELTVQKDNAARALAPFQSQDRIERVAKNVLGMDYPTKQQVNYVDVGLSPEPVEQEQENNLAEKLRVTIFGLLRY